MKVDPRTHIPPAQDPGRVADAKPPVQVEREQVQRTTEDQARISVDREKVQRLQVELAKLPDIRQDRVDALRRSLAEGSYRIDENRVAEAIRNDMFEVKPPGE